MVDTANTIDQGPSNEVANQSEQCFEVKIKMADESDQNSLHMFLNCSEFKARLLRRLCVSDKRDVNIMPCLNF